MSTVATHCPYCALQCGILLRPTAEGVTVTPDARFPVNKGGLCVKGWTAAAALTQTDRLTQPLVRTGGGTLAPVSWEVAFGDVAERFRAIGAKHGSDAVGVFGGGSLTNEKVYLLGVRARRAPHGERRL